MVAAPSSCRLALGAARGALRLVSFASIVPPGADAGLGPGGGRGQIRPPAARRGPPTLIGRSSHEFRGVWGPKKVRKPENRLNP